MTYDHRAEEAKTYRNTSDGVRYFTPRGGCSCRMKDGRTLTTGDVITEADPAYRQFKARMRQVGRDYAENALREQTLDVEAGVVDAVPEPRPVPAPPEPEPEPEPPESLDYEDDDLTVDVELDE